MSIDFTKVKGWEIPEGKVTKITDALGNVLWNAVKMANLTITSFWDGMDGDTARITINSPSPFAPNPNEPNNKVTSWTAYVYDLFDQQNRTIKIPVGSTIECYITRDKGNAGSYIKLNDVSVATGEGTYVYTVTGDATIDVSEEYIQGDFGVISITGAVTYISFTINGETYQSIEGMTWNAWFASDYNTTGKAKSDVENIKDANGNEVSLDAVIVDGTAYEVGFTKMVKIIVPYDLNEGNNPMPYIDGGGVGSAAGTYEVPLGTRIYVGFSHRYTSERTSIYFNGEYVKGGGGDSGGSYSVEYGFEATLDMTIMFYGSTAYIADSTMKMATSIAVTTPPTKTEYLSGDTFDPTGMVVVATYSDGTTAEITDYFISPTTVTKSTKQISISYSSRGPSCYTSTPISVTPVPVTITITGSGYSSRCYAKYSSTTYTSGDTFTAYKGDYIYCYARSSGTGQAAQIILNDEVVKSATNSSTGYSYYPDSDATINLEYSASGSVYSSTITITEE